MDWLLGLTFDITKEIWNFIGLHMDVTISGVNRFFNGKYHEQYCWSTVSHVTFNCIRITDYNFMNVILKNITNFSLIVSLDIRSCMIQSWRLQDILTLFPKLQTVYLDNLQWKFRSLFCSNRRRIESFGKYCMETAFDHYHFDPDGRLNEQCAKRLERFYNFRLIMNCQWFSKCASVGVIQEIF